MNDKQREGWFTILFFLTLLFGCLLVFSIGSFLVYIFGLLLAISVILIAGIIIEGKDDRNLRYKINKKRRKLN